MKLTESVRYPALYTLWAVLFVLTAVLGFFFPAAEGAVKIALMTASVLFFLPPWLIVVKAKKEKNRHHVLAVRLLAIASLVLTTVLICLSILSVGNDAMGDLLHRIMTVVSAPMICSNFYALPLFLWAALLFRSF